MILTKKVIIRWNSSNKKHFTSKGHQYTKINEEFEVDICDLTDTTSVPVDIICDNCGKHDIKDYKRIKNKAINFCSKECADFFRKGKGSLKVERIEINCGNCGTKLHKTESQIKRSKNIFCNRECANLFMKGKEFEERQKRTGVNCYTCTHPFDLPNYRIEENKRYFCSRDCQSTWQRSDEYKTIHQNTNIEKVGKIEVDCFECAKKFDKWPSEIRSDRNFCGSECRNMYLIKNNPNPKKKKVEVNCFHCGQGKLVHESIKEKNKYHFCSKECYWEWRTYSLSGENSPNYNRVEKPCDQCGIEIKVIPFELSEKKNNFCSQKCYWKYRSVHYTGENHPHFGRKLSPEHIQKMRIGLVKQLENGTLTRNTTIQKIINSILDDLEIEYVNEYNCKYYSIDNYLSDYELMIEVMGDYWHTNPVKYCDLDKITDKQRDGIRRDKSKKTYIKKYKKINVLYLWETDIKQRPNDCAELILYYINNGGNIDDYNSFNYHLDENEHLKLNDEVIKPYFMINKNTV